MPDPGSLNGQTGILVIICLLMALCAFILWASRPPDGDSPYIDDEEEEK